MDDAHSLRAAEKITRNISRTLIFGHSFDCLMRKKSIIIAAVIQIVLFNHVGAFLADHNSRSICIAGRNVGHNAGIHYSQPIHTVHL